jgi:serine/threonine-protein kinase
MPPELSAGATVGGFRIESLLARGAMAEVYRARDGNDRAVALKLLDPTLAHDERFRQRFVRESELAATLAHPNIVATLASGEDRGRLYLALELVDGPDLRDVLRQEGRLDPERVVALVEQVAAGLDAAHAAGLVHRDVKPGNIVVRTQDGGEHASICDFGLARHVSSVSSLTGERGFVGTIDYVPPEQIEGGSIDSRADVYSLGCVLYECLAGRRPFERDSELSVVFAHLNEPPPLLTDVRPELPDAFDEVIATVLAKSPDERYSSAGELAAAARAALHGEVLARRKPRRRLLIAGIAAAVAAAVAVPLAVLLPSHSEPVPVTITPTSIRGGRLGDSSALLERMWGNGYQLLQMQFPPSYTLLTVRSRNLSAFFAGADDKAVELVTANRADRNAQGIGPCSSLDELRRVYGKRLKPSPNSTSPDGKLIFGWTVGKHLFFAMGPGPDELGPNEQPARVETVALYSNSLGNAGFNASNAAPCTLAPDSTPVTRPTSLPAVKKPPLPRTLVARRFVPHLSMRAPAGWRVRSDEASGYTIASPTGGTLAFRLDPFAVGADGRPLADVSRTPNGLATWLENNGSLAVTSPAMSLLGHPALTVFRLDLKASASSGAAYLGFPGAGSTLRVDPRRPVRLYLAQVRLDTLVHTLAVTVEAQSASTLRSLLPTVQSILGSLRVRAAAVQPVLPLSVLCTQVFYGTCLGELRAGTHSTSTFRPKLTYTVPVGWTNSGDKPGYMGLIPPGGDRGAVDIGKSDYINVFTRVTTGNGHCADGHGTARTPEELVRWFRSQPAIAPFTAERTSIGGLDGLVVDLRMRRGWRAPCPWSRGLPAQQAITGLAPSPDEMNHSLLPQPMVMRLYLLRYNGGTLAIEIDEVRGDSKLPAYSKVVESFRFAPS